MSLKVVGETRNNNLEPKENLDLPCLSLFVYPEKDGKFQMPLNQNQNRLRSERSWGKTFEDHSTNSKPLFQSPRISNGAIDSTNGISNLIGGKKLKISRKFPREIFSINFKGKMHSP